MNTALSFDDVKFLQQFSEIESRETINTEVDFLGTKLTTPVVSSNMRCITNATMATAMKDAGAVGCLHRFWSVGDNVEALKASPSAWVSVGLGADELERAYALKAAGASVFVLDVAHGATMAVVKQAKAVRGLIGESDKLIVGNFDNKDVINTFISHAGQFTVDAFKVGIGGGGACITGVVTGVGLPLFTAITDCVKSGRPIIADGGIRNSGDFSKALAAGASVCMSGRMFIDTKESATQIRYPVEVGYNGYKIYSGSASEESYAAQGKISEWRTPEGESYRVPYTDQSVKDVIKTLNAGLRSSMSYNGAKNLNEFRAKAKFVQVSEASAKEALAHGKT